MRYVSGCKNEIVLYNTGLLGKWIQDALEESVCMNENVSFRYIEGVGVSGLEKNTNYLCFYIFSNNEDIKMARDYANKEKINISFAAICDNFEEGIASMRKGDFYALHLPLAQEKITKCYEIYLGLK